MKNRKKPAAGKLVAKFDNELMKLLKSDLKLFMAKDPFLMRKKQAALQPALSVA